jgi:DNA-binding LacI/PurR family transcriptional regulator
MGTVSASLHRPLGTPFARLLMVKRRATIVEVAARANVAFSTVSRVMNGGCASQQVRERVKQAAKDLGYTPSSIARNLKMGRQGCIGVIVESSQGSWFTQVLGGIEESLAQKTASALLLGSVVARGRYDSSAVATWIAEHRVDGLIFARCTRRERDLVEQAQKARIPMVFIAPDEHFGAGPVFVSRNREAAHDLAVHLLELGHRRFGFLGGPEESTDTCDRLAGIEEALAARGLHIDPPHRWFAGSYRREGATGFAEEWLQTPRDQAPTAVVCANDALAIAFMRMVLQRGVRVPAEVSVAGFDGVAEGALYWPGLTSARQDSHEMGRAACQALLRLIEAPDQSVATRIELPTELVIRESSGPPPRR